MPELTLKIGNRMSLQVSSPEEASKKYGLMRDLAGEGASTWPDGHLSNGMHIRYNGRVWTGEYSTNPKLVCEAQH